MPLDLDSCIAGVFTPGNIGASSGLPPVEPVVPSRAPVTKAAAVVETSTAVDAIAATAPLLAAIVESATAADVVNAGTVAVARSAMLPGVFVNSAGTSREAYVDGSMVNL